MFFSSKLTLVQGGDVNYPTEPQSAIHVATFHGNKPIMLKILEPANANVNIQV